MENLETENSIFPFFQENRKTLLLLNKPQVFQQQLSLEGPKGLHIFMKHINKLI